MRTVTICFWLAYLCKMFQRHLSVPLRAPKRTEPTPLDLLNRVSSLTWLSKEQLRRVSDSLSVIHVGRHELIFEDLGEVTPYAYLLLAGIAQLTGLGPRGERVVVAMISPGYLFTVPSLPPGVGHHFRWEAYSDCIVGRLPLERLIDVALGSHDHFIRMAGIVNAHLGSLLARYPSFLGFSLRRRVAIALLELASEFGIRDARGMLLRVVPTHQTLANLVGASRPKVTEVMRNLQRHKLIIREDHRLAIPVTRLREFVRSDTA